VVDRSQRPADSSFEFFETAIRGHSRVKRLARVADQAYVVERQSLPEVRVWLCDIYTLGVADYYAIRDADPEVNAIVVVSIWNSYTADAVQQARNDDVGIFTPKEFMSALHRSGSAFFG
jgi:hypothetical protein